MNSKLAVAAVCSGLIVSAFGVTRAAYAAPPKDACSLLTPAQVSAELGVPVAGKNLGPQSCIWLQTGVKPGSARRRVDFTFLILQGYNLAKSVGNTPNSPTSETPVSGLGDDAYYYAMRSGHEYLELRVRKGSEAFAIRVQRSGTPFTVDQIKAKEKTLALDILAKL